jgi:two-component system chemotaxis response regulator CheY
MHLHATAKILIADDMPAMLTGLKRALSRLGFTDVVEAEDGAAALLALETHTDTALIISDWNMEPMDGLEFLRRVRADGRFRKLPFILASADAGPSLREQAARDGVSLVLAKPFDAETLRIAIASLEPPL